LEMILIRLSTKDLLVLRVNISKSKVIAEQIRIPGKSDSQNRYSTYK
jgi:hypothetical protein